MICTCAQSHHHSGLRLSHGVSLGLCRCLSPLFTKAGEAARRRIGLVPSSMAGHTSHSSATHAWPSEERVRVGECISYRYMCKSVPINACVQEKGGVAAAQSRRGSTVPLCTHKFSQNSQFRHSRNGLARADSGVCVGTSMAKSDDSRGLFRSRLLGRWQGLRLTMARRFRLWPAMLLVHVGSRDELSFVWAVFL